MLNLEATKGACELCGCADSVSLLKAQGTDIHSIQIFQVVKCRACGLVYLYPRIARQEYQELDTAEFYKRQKDLFHRFFDLCLDFFILSRLKKFRRFFKNLGSVLDVGCGEGKFLKAMASFGWDVYGVDVSANAIEAAKAKDLKQLWCQDIFDAQLPNARFDLITFWQSFEHLAEPLQALKKVAALLKRDGMIFVSVPNIDSLEARMSLKSWFGLDLPRHHFLYSPRTLKRLLEAAGFKVIALNKNSLEYNVPMFMMTFLNFLRGETNWFYNFVKRHEFARTNLLLREYTVLLSIFLIPFILVFSPFLYVTNIMSGNGSVIEIFARSKDV